MLLCACARGEGELFKAGVVSGCWMVVIMVGGRLWYCEKMCSRGNWKLFYPELDWKLKLCLSCGPLLQLFQPKLRAHYIWIILIWMRDFSAWGRTWLLLAVKMLQEAPWCLVGTGDFSNRTVLTVQLWGFQVSPACNSGKYSLWEWALHPYQSEYRASIYYL